MVATSGRPAAHDGFAGEAGGRRSATHSHDDPRDLGATAVEYAIMAAFIAAVIVVSVTVFGTAVVALFDSAAGI